VEAVQRPSTHTRFGQIRDQIGTRRATNIGKVAAARELLTLVYYGLRGGRSMPPCGEGMTDSPHRACPHPGHRTGARTRPPPGTTPNPFSAVNSMRRTASASRTSGRYAVGPRAGLCPDAIPGAPKPSGETEKKDHDSPQGLDRPPLQR
jgi:hypothetical protein